ncbi:MAG: DEAD/DEAH box helicase, partial [Formosimonas sp.]
MTQTAAAPTDFSVFNLDERLQRAINDSGYTVPTPIQAQAIPVVLTGQDVMGSAQTGTGKTASFTLPILQKLLPLASSSTSPARHPVRALVLCPTRELAVQVADNAVKYAKHSPIRTAVVFGGMDFKSQTPALRAGVEFLVATPGRLLDHLEQGNVSLAQVQYLVLDEADRMLDMGFLPDLQRILNLLPKSRQTLLFSATFSPEIRKLAQSYQNNPVTIETAQRNATSNNVTQTAYQVTADDKRRSLVHLIRSENVEQAIIFVNKKLEARSLTRFLQQEKVDARALHGDQTQNERLATLEDFKKGQVKIMVATDVAARGLDISDMPCVINYDLPFSAEDYVHRIGRTGRAGA